MRRKQCPLPSGPSHFPCCPPPRRRPPPHRRASTPGRRRCSAADTLFTEVLCPISYTASEARRRRPTDRPTLTIHRPAPRAKSREYLPHRSFLSRSYAIISFSRDFLTRPRIILPPRSLRQLSRNFFQVLLGRRTLDD